MQNPVTTPLLQQLNSNININAINYEITKVTYGYTKPFYQ